MSELYRLSKLVKRFGQREVLCLPWLAIPEGGITALLGANGAGKTTLLRILSFLDAPSSGQVSFRGQRVRYTERELRPLRREVIMVDQHPILFSTTVGKNVEYGLRIRKVAAAERDRRVDEALEMVGMRAYRRERAVNLSGGETQRVALARVLALRPRVLLCDEPTASVDAVNQVIISELLAELSSAGGMTIVLTTHDHDMAAALAAHTIALDRTGGANGERP